MLLKSERGQSHTLSTSSLQTNCRYCKTTTPTTHLLTFLCNQALWRSLREQAEQWWRMKIGANYSTWSLTGFTSRWLIFLLLCTIIKNILIVKLLHVLQRPNALSCTKLINSGFTRVLNIQVTDRYGRESNVISKTLTLKTGKRCVCHSYFFNYLCLIFICLINTQSLIINACCIYIHDIMCTALVVYSDSKPVLITSDSAHYQVHAAGAGFEPLFASANASVTTSVPEL